MRKAELSRRLEEAIIDGAVGAIRERRLLELVGILRDHLRSAGADELVGTIDATLAEPVSVIIKGKGADVEVVMP